MIGPDVTATPERGRPGVILKLMGAILMMLGTLDSLLTLRGGIPAHEFLILIAIGAAIFGAGAVRARYGAADRDTAVADESDARRVQERP